jgi:hypothetical protein
MGIIYRQAKMLLDAHQSGMQMDHLLMIGRQALLLHPPEVRAIRKICPGALAGYEWGEYADRFFTECLGVSYVSALDYSSYEGADILHDLNQPVPANLRERFDVVVEGGSLEHVFNFPVAIANIMQMTKVGGTICASTVSNNLCGHGFYQFSPELIFRVFTAENGFELGKVLALEARYPGIELAPITRVFEVVDPALARVRVGLMTAHPIMLLFSAHKIAQVAIFSNAPMQSDYAAVWASPGRATSPRMPKWVRSLPFYSSFRRSSIVHSFKNWLTGRRQLKWFSLENKRLFKKL